MAITYEDILQVELSLLERALKAEAEVARVTARVKELESQLPKIEKKDV